MDYKIFKEMVKESIQDYMPEKFSHYDVGVQPVQKVNGTLDGLYMAEPGKAGMAAAPTVYLEQLYEDYKRTEDFQGTLEAAAFCLSEGLEQAAGMEKICFSEPETSLVFTLINTEQNQDLLSGIPNRPFQDLSVVYRYVTSMDEEGLSSVLVNQRIAESMGLSEEQLFQMAEENTKKLMPPQVTDIKDILKGILKKDGMPPEMADTMLENMPETIPMYVVTNSRQINGAVSMVFDDVLHGLAEELGTDLYLLPSSIHEVIAVPIKTGNPKELAQMVEEINLGQVPLEERLSNQVYCYDRKGHHLSIATDTPWKRLDGIVPEKTGNQEKKQR